MSASASSLTVRFEGEYRVAGGDWQTITQDTHIPTTKGDVTLRGYFVQYTPNGD